MKQRKIYVVGKDIQYCNWMEGTIVNKMEEADLVVFTGGEDVSPEYYNDKQHPTTSPNPYRDHREKSEFILAVSMKKHMIGICRGGQFLCVMAGGKLVQDMTGHAYIHEIKAINDDGTTQVVNVTSSHHQMQYPWNLPADEYKIIGYCNLSHYHEGGNCKEMNCGKSTEVLGKRFYSQSETNNDLPEVEIASYPKIKALCIQSHPEYEFNDENEEMIMYFRALLDKHLNT